MSNNKTDNLQSYEDILHRYRIIGHLLYSERVFRHLSTFDVSRILKLSTYVINHLEEGDLKAGPGPIFMEKFLRSYAKFLEVNIIEEDGDLLPFRSSHILENENIIKTPLTSTKSPSRKVFIGALISLVTLLGWRYYKISQETKNPPPIMEVSLLEPSPTHHSLSNLKHLPSSSQPSDNITLHITDECWVSIRTENGKIIQQGLMHAGDTLSLPSTFKGFLDIGNAGGVFVKYKDKQSLPLGKKGTVLRKYNIDLKKLLHKS